MAGMGPPPNPNRRRRNATPNTIKLPAEGRKGRAPKWPLVLESEAEHVLWLDLWKTPQAVMWERLGWTRIVARYARCVVLAEDPDFGDKKATATASLLSEVRQLEDRLGLTPKAMQLLHWEVVVDELAERRAERQSSRTRKVSLA